MELYASTYEAAWRARARLLGIPVTAHLRLLEQSQRLPREQILELQWAKLRRLLVHAYENVPFYRRRFETMRAHPHEIRNRDDFARIPPLTRQELEHNAHDLVARNLPARRLVANATGGSTGRPVHFHVDREYLYWAQAMVWLQDSWTGWSPGRRHAFLWGSRLDLEQQQAGKVRLYNRLARNLFLDAFAVDPGALDRYLRRLRRFRPALLTGYVLPLQILARRAQQGAFGTLSIGAVQTGAEPLRPAQRAIIEEGLGAPVFERYGGRDIGSLAHECEAHQGMHLFPLNYAVESLRDDRPAVNGESGELILTHLDNYGAPFIRYRSDDLGVLSDRVCPCGRTWPMLERVEGRLADCIVGPSGAVMSGLFFPHLFKDFDIGQYQVIQETVGSLRILLAAGHGFGPEQQARIEEVIRQHLGNEMQIAFEFMESIPRAESGKFRVVISHVAAPEHGLRTPPMPPERERSGDRE